MVSEKYSRQVAIKGWNQEAIGKQRCCVVGNDRLSDFIVADLLALGIGNITRIGASDFFEFDKINRDARLEQVDTELFSREMAEIYIPEADFIVEASNNPEQKQVVLGLAEKRGVKVISAAAARTNFLFKIGSLDETINFHLEDYYGQEQGNLNSLVCSAMVADELRKRIFPLEYDTQSSEFFYQGLNEQDRDIAGKRIVMIGAGGIGTFAGLGLALEGCNVKVIDFDVVEESNLNRQIFFHDAIRDYKSSALAGKLQKYGGRFEGLVEKVDEDFDPEGSDIIMSCVDNIPAREILNRIAARSRIPLVNGGISLYEGEANGYIPGSTSCLDCQMLGVLSKKREEEKKGAACIIYPSLIMPNQIIGGLVVEEVKKIIHEGDPKILRYSSGEGIFEETPQERCSKECSLYKNDR